MNVGYSFWCIHFHITALPLICALAFNLTTVTLDFASMPPASPLALRAVEDEMFAQLTRVNITIAFTSSLSHPRPTPSVARATYTQRRRRHDTRLVGTPPGHVSEGLVLWLDAATLGGQQGSPVPRWQSQVAGTTASQLTPGQQPTLDPNGLGPGIPAVHFDGATQFLVGNLTLGKR